MATTNANTATTVTTHPTKLAAAEYFKRNKPFTWNFEGFVLYLTLIQINIVVASQTWNSLLHAIRNNKNPCKGFSDGGKRKARSLLNQMNQGKTLSSAILNNINIAKNSGEVNVGGNHPQSPTPSRIYSPTPTPTLNPATEEPAVEISPEFTLPSKQTFADILAQLPPQFDKEEDYVFLLRLGAIFPTKPSLPFDTCDRSYLMDFISETAARQEDVRRQLTELMEMCDQRLGEIDEGHRMAPYVLQLRLLKDYLPTCKSVSPFGGEGVVDGIWNPLLDAALRRSGIWTNRKEITILGQPSKYDGVFLATDYFNRSITVPFGVFEVKPPRLYKPSPRGGSGAARGRSDFCKVVTALHEIFKQLHTNLPAGQLSAEDAAALRRVTLVGIVFEGFNVNVIKARALTPGVMVCDDVDVFVTEADDSWSVLARLIWQVRLHMERTHETLRAIASRALVGPSVF